MLVRFIEMFDIEEDLALLYAVLYGVTLERVGTSRALLLYAVLTGSTGRIFEHVGDAEDGD